MANKIKVLITSVGSTNGINVLNALKDKGYKLVSGDSNELSAGLWMTKRKYIFPRADEYALMPAIMQVCKHEKINVIFPTHSKEILKLSELTDGFRELGLNMCLSPTDVYLITESKITCGKVLKEMGIDVPEVYEEIKFPAIIKPISSSGTKNTHKLENEKDFEYYKDQPDSFISEFIEGQEYVVDGVSDLNGKVIACLPRIRIEARGGLCVKAQTIKDKDLETTAKKIANNLKMVGAWNIQFIKNDTRTVVIDVNNRLAAGGTPLDVYSGLNIPDIMVHLALGEKVKKPKIKYGKRMLRYWSSICLKK
jgi:carbamoyl-phosphate synthase large subunit